VFEECRVKPVIQSSGETKELGRGMERWVWYRRRQEKRVVALKSFTCVPHPISKAGLVGASRTISINVRYCYPGGTPAELKLGEEDSSARRKDELLKRITGGIATAAAKTYEWSQRSVKGVKWEDYQERYLPARLDLSAITANFVLLYVQI
jgi:hypothetical protein